ncbi:hypothetical protein ILYODFUR_004913 [Ilyodon furcidens]|uniref:Uncharacterized protein n=1 Tax=Ilyodon furcidens TaxID=33524 RepID=A0ABV0TS04_9TELE
MSGLCGGQNRVSVILIFVRTGGKVSAGVNRAQTAFVVSPSELPLLPAEPNRGATHAQRRARRRGSAPHRAFVTSGNAESRCRHKPRRMMNETEAHPHTKLLVSCLLHFNPSVINSDNPAFRFVAD